METILNILMVIFGVLAVFLFFGAIIGIIDAGDAQARGYSYTASDKREEAGALAAGSFIFSILAIICFAVTNYLIK